MLTRSTVYGAVPASYYPWNSFLFWYALIFFIIFFPFLVCNLYYAYQDPSCVDFRPPPNANDIKMSLAQWLQVDAYIMLGFIVFFFIIGIIAWTSPHLICCYGFWEGLHVFYIIWRMTWLIVGAVIFWKGLNPTGFCDTRVRRYMFAMLIIGFIWLFVELFLAFGYPRPVRYPVAVPVPLTSTPIIGSPVPTPFVRPILV